MSGQQQQQQQEEEQGQEVPGSDQSPAAWLGLQQLSGAAETGDGPAFCRP